MKLSLPFFVIAILCSFRVAHAAAVSLHVPIFVQDWYPDPVPMATVNPQIVQLGGTSQPEFFDFEPGHQNDFWKKANVIETAIENGGLKHASLVYETYPGEANTPSLATCYNGDGKLVADLVGELVDGPYSDQLTMRGWKLGKDSVIFDGASDTQEFISAGSVAWRTYDTNSDVVLIVSSVGDDGNDIETSLIPPCK